MEFTLSMILYFLRPFRPEVLHYPPSAKTSVRRQIYSGIFYLIPGRQELKPDILYLCTQNTLLQVSVDHQPDRISEEPTFLVLCSSDDCSTLSLPFSAQIITVTGTSMHPAELFNYLTDCYNRVTIWDKQMHIGALEGKTPQELLDLSEDIIKHPVLLFDSAFQLLGHSKKYQAKNSGYLEAVRIGYTAPQTMQETRDANILSMLEPQQALIAPAVEEEQNYNVYYAFSWQQRLLGYACVFCDKNIPENGYIDLLQIFFNNMNYCLQTHYGDNHFSQMMYETILLNLMHQEPVSDDWLKDRLSGIPHLRERGNYVLEVQELENTENLSFDFLMRFLTIQFPQLNPFAFEGRICLLLSSKEKAFLTREEIRNLSFPVKQAMKNYAFHTGFSCIFHNIRDISYAYRQAVFALQMDTRQENRNPNEDHFFMDFLYTYLLAQTDQLMPVSLLQSELYRRMKRNDTEEKTSYLKTLLTYLLCDCNATKTANKLYIHRNTVRNMINQIEERYHVSVHDTNIKKQMVLSEEIERYLQDK